MLDVNERPLPWAKLVAVNFQTTWYCLKMHTSM